MKRYRERERERNTEKHREKQREGDIKWWVRARDNRERQRENYRGIE
jgi:hypothetical protein